MKINIPVPDGQLVKAVWYDAVARKDPILADDIEKITPALVTSVGYLVGHEKATADKPGYISIAHETGYYSAFGLEEQQLQFRSVTVIPVPWLKKLALLWEEGEDEED